MSHFDDDYSADSLMREISQSLGEQVSSEMEHKEQEKEGGFSVPDKEMGEFSVKKKNTKKIFAIAAGVLVVLCLLVAGTGYYFLSRMNYEDDSDLDLVTESGEPLDLKDSEYNVEPADSSVINVLLIGEEKIEDTNRGRSDAMLVATINQTQKSLKLTSVMRDCYVSIPGHRDHKLNTAYNEGGGPLLVATIEQNFQIHLDGYARVDFEAFEKIIDKLGGVEIELSEREADYLNRTNYISKPANRTMKAGVNTMNGNQALGYSRVRKVSEVEGEGWDFGRTARQRRVLNCIFEKYKSKNLLEMVGLANEILPYITTNLSKTDILSYIASFVATGSMELETLRVPIDDSYLETRRDGAGSVLVLDFEKNNAALQEFIYGQDGTAAGNEDNAANGENGENGESTDGQQNGDVGTEY